MRDPARRAQTDRLDSGVRRSAAGFCALVNEARANAGKPALTFFLPPQI